MGSYVLFYHYTSDRGLTDIKSSGYIKNSSHDDKHAWFGEGTYGTSLPPSMGKQKIAQNNWTKHGKFYIKNGKVNWAIEVKIPRKKVRNVSRRNRDILVYDGPIYLDDYEWRALRVPNTCDPHGTYDEDDDLSVPVSAPRSRGTPATYSQSSTRYTTRNQTYCENTSTRDDGYGLWEDRNRATGSRPIHLNRNVPNGNSGDDWTWILVLLGVSAVGLLWLFSK